MAHHRNRSASLLLVLAAVAFAAASWFLLVSAPRAAQPPSAFASGLTAARRLARSPNVAMQSEKVDTIVASLKELTLLEASELVKAIEETFGVDASASGGAVMMAAPTGGGGGEDDKPAEKSEFDVILKEV